MSYLLYDLTCKSVSCQVVGTSSSIFRLDVMLVLSGGSELNTLARAKVSNSCFVSVSDSAGDGGKVRQRLGKR